MIGTTPTIEAVSAVLILFTLHASVLMLSVWALERSGGLKHPGWAEFAWRAALLGAFVSIAVLASPLRQFVRPANESAAFVSAVAARPPSLAANEITPSAESTSAESKRDAETISTSAFAAAPRLASGSAPHLPSLSPVSLRIDDRALLAMLSLWLLGGALTLLSIARQAFGLLRFKRRVRQRREPASEAMRTSLSRLAQEMGVREPALYLLPELTSPLVISGTILLPKWAEGLDGAQRSTMLAHELAHLRRRDPFWRLLQRMALAPLFFHPLAWLAVRRLEALAETLCDRIAIEHGGEDRNAAGRALAECLAECLARRSDRPNPTLALAMAEHSHGIVVRVRTLLETSQMKFSSIPKPLRWIAAMLILSVLIALPSVLVIARDDTPLSVTFRNGNTTYAMRSSMPYGERFRIDAQGDFQFNDAESDIARLGPGATFEIEQTRAGKTREIRYANVAGTLQRRYFVDGREQPLDADGKAWLAGVMPEFYRNSGFQADLRVKRMLANGGLDKVLDEIALIKTDGGRAEYLAQLFAQADPNPSQFERALAFIAPIESAFEKRRALTAALKETSADPQSQARMLTIATGIDSDFDRAEWLTQAAARLPVTEQTMSAWTKALAAVGGDFERRRTIEALIDEGTPRLQAVATALVATRKLSGDFERRSALEKAASSGAAFSDGVYLQLVDGIGSDFDRREALIALVRGGEPSLERSRGILRSVRGIGSDFERGEVLTALAGRMPNDPALIEDYRAVARLLADHERGEAERALDRFY